QTRATLRPMLAGAAVAAIAVTIAGCGSSGGGGGGGGGGGSEVTSIKLGFMGDLSGANAGIVTPPFNGATLAVEQYNATTPKVKVELKKYDSQGKPEQAVPLAQTAIKTDKIVGLIGPAFSGESKNVGPVLEE